MKCHIESQKKCQAECQTKWQRNVSEYMPDRMTDRMSAGMPVKHQNTCDAGCNVSKYVR